MAPTLAKAASSKFRCAPHARHRLIEASRHRPTSGRYRRRLREFKVVRLEAGNTQIKMSKKGVGRVYQQTFIDASAVARPPASQAPGAQLAEVTTPLPLVCAE